MPAAPKPADEAIRLACLRALNILDTMPEAVFDGFIRLACSVLQVPVAAFSLIDADRQWFKSSRGMEVTETPRDEALCAYTILQPNEVTVVADARLDPRFADHPDVTGSPGIRFYAGAPVLDRNGYALGALWVVDHAPRELSMQELQHLTDLAAGISAALQLHGAIQIISEAGRTDPLTGAGSRAALDATLAQLREVPPRNGGTAVLLLDLDGFRQINDRFGHAGGDAALQEMATRLRRTLRPRDLLVRLAGDEFALVCHGIATPQALPAIEGRLRTAMADTFALDGVVVPLRISIGSALLPQDHADPEAVLALADARLYARKRGTGDGTAANAPLASPGRIRLREALREALLPPGREPFTLAFQPVIGLGELRRGPTPWNRSPPPARAGGGHGLEALIRWPSDGRLISPGDFIPMAEEGGLISHLDRWVLFRACALAALWPRPWNLSVNISAANVALGGMEEMVREALATSGLPAARLTVELTETVLAHERDGALAAIQSLRDLGVGVALDDFGGGHASLTYLHRFPFSVVKVDRGLVRNLGEDARAEAVMATVVELGHTLGVPVVAEGVETMRELQILHRLGVDRAQGFLLARPVPENQVAQAIEAAIGVVAGAEIIIG